MKRTSALVAALASMAWSQIQTAPSEPVFSPRGQTFKNSLSVTISCSSSFTAYNYVFYTLDKSEPTNSGYNPGTSVRLTLSSDTTVVKAICADGTSQFSSKSNVVTEIYTLQALTLPIITPTANYVSGATVVTIKTTEANTQIYYTTDGTEPKESGSGNNSGVSFTISPTLAKPVTVKAFSTKTGWGKSPTSTVTYYKKEITPTPVALPKDTTYTNNLVITLSTTTSTALPIPNLYYTVDGSNPKTNKNRIYYGAPINLYGNNQIAGTITTIRAFAIKESMDTSAELLAKYTYTPKAPTPTTDQTESFIDTTLVTLTIPQPIPQGAEIRYILKDGEPTNTSLLYNATSPIRLDTTTTISARTFVPNPKSGELYQNSDVFRKKFKLSLSPPAASPSNDSIYEYANSLNIKLSSVNKKAIISYTLNGVIPSPKDKIGTQYKEINGFGIGDGSNDTTIVTAIALTQDSTVLSNPVSWTYVKKENPKVAAPQATPRSTGFTDSISVTLSHSDPNASIVYTLDGSEPKEEGPSVKRTTNGKVLRLGATTTLKMWASLPGFPGSDLDIEEYRLRPAKPEAQSDPKPRAGIYELNTAIQLTCATPGASILFALGDGIFDVENTTLFSADKPIIIKANTHLKAISVLGVGSSRMFSEAILDLNYTVLQPNSDSLVLGADGIKSNIYNLKLTNPTATPVKVQFDAAPSGKVGIVLQPTVHLESVYSNGLVDVVLKPIQNTATGLYEIIDGELFFIALIPKDSSAKISKAGTYVLGQDTLAPRIKWLGQVSKVNDSTEIQLELTDEISNSIYQVQTSTDLIWRKEVIVPSAKYTLILSCKNPRENRTELWFRLKASDHLHSTYFPADTSQRFVLTQAFDTLKTDPLTLGEANYKWDLVGFPSSDQTPVTLDQLAKVHSAFSFKAFVWNTSDQTYQNVDPLSPLTAGKGLWLAANKPIKTLDLPAIQTAASDTNGQFHIKLHPGWNMISNPSLGTLWWPITHAGLLESPTERVRALRGYTASIFDYSYSDSLSPWRGYFVKSKLPQGKDTVITLLRKKPVGSASKKSTHSNKSASDPWYLSLGEENRLALTLGSYAGTQNSVGPEDEGVLTSPDGRGPRLHSQRDGHRLQEDFVNGSPNEVHRFSLAFGSLDKTVAVPPVHVWSSELNGQEAWAWLPRRGLRQQLVPGDELAWWPSSSDSLQILVGPSSLLMQYPGFTAAKLSPSTFHCSLVTGHNNPKLRLFLNELTEIRVVEFRPNGKRSNLIRQTVLGIGEQNLDIYPENRGFIQVLGRPVSGAASWSQLLRF